MNKNNLAEWVLAHRRAVVTLLIMAFFVVAHHHAPHRIGNFEEFLSGLQLAFHQAIIEHVRHIHFSQSKFSISSHGTRLTCF